LGLDCLLTHKQRLRKLWQETRDPACKTALNWVTKTIRRMAWKRTLERWETKIENCEVTPHAIWPIAKSLTKRGGPKAPTCNSWSFRPSILSKRESQCNCKLLRKSVYAAQIVWLADEKGSLKSETVKYGRQSQGTRTRERLRCKSQQHVQMTDPSSRQREREREQYRNYQTVINITKTYWLTDRHSQCDSDFEETRRLVWNGCQPGTPLF
jgi:hypothetical protein